MLCWCREPVYNSMLNNRQIMIFNSEYKPRKPDTHATIRVIAGLIVTLSASLVWPVQFLWWMPRSVAELLQGRALSGWSGAGLVPPCPDEQWDPSDGARNILIEISRWSILCLHCVRYWVPITGNAGHYTLHTHQLTPDLTRRYSI